MEPAPCPARRPTLLSLYPIKHPMDAKLLKNRTDRCQIANRLLSWPPFATAAAIRRKLRLGGSLGRDRRSMERFQYLPCALPADVHQVGIVGNLAQHGLDGVQLLGIVAGLQLNQFLQGLVHAQLVEAVLKLQLAAVIESGGDALKK